MTLQCLIHWLPGDRQQKVSSLAGSKDSWVCFCTHREVDLGRILSSKHPRLGYLSHIAAE